MFEIKKCDDCIHADVCEHNPNIPLFNRANAAFCEEFKDRNELIEVVRCKDASTISHKGSPHIGTEQPLTVEEGQP